MQRLIRDKSNIAMYSGLATTLLTNVECAPHDFHCMFDTYSQAAEVAAALTKMWQKSWYFVTVDYAFGQSLEKDALDMLKSLGGTVVGSVRHPLNSSDFSSFLPQAQSSKAQVIGLTNGGQEMVNAIKAAHSFDIGTKN